MRPSVSQLWRISYPLMLSMLSQGLMSFVDRVFLGKYSLDAMNAAAGAWMTSAALIFAFVAIAAISGVFVGTYNGKGDHHLVSRPVWQMLWFALASNILFIPYGLFGAQFVLADAFFAAGGEVYFTYTACFASLWIGSSALTGFYVGIGKTRLITVATVIGNLVNLGLDYLLIFGLEGVIEPMGIQGAVLATVIGEGLRFSLLAYGFWNAENNQKYQTRKSVFHKQQFLECLRIGYPKAISHGLEIGAWAFCINIIAGLGTIFITTYSVIQSMMHVFGFIGEGLSEGATSLSSNAFGAKKYDDIKKVFHSGFKLHCIMLLMVFGVFIWFPELLLNTFFDLDADTLYHTVIGLRLLWLWLVFDGLAWIIAGILTSAGDTRFIMGWNLFCVWGCGVLPLILILKPFALPPWSIFGVFAFYAIALFTGMYLRYRNIKWDRIDLKIAE